MATPATDRAPRRAARAALLLLIVAVAGFGLVAVVHQATRARIAEIAHREMLARFTEVMHGRRFDNDPLRDTVAVQDPERLGTARPLVAYRARWHGDIVAVVLTPIAPDGYAGAIRLLVAIAPDGTLLGARVTEQHETPGLGDAIDARKSHWIDQFVGRSLRDPAAERWRVRKDGGDFDQFTGATITPRAVVTAIARALEYFELHRAALLAAPATMPRP